MGVGGIKKEVQVQLCKQVQPKSQSWFPLCNSHSVVKGFQGQDELKTHLRSSRCEFMLFKRKASKVSPRSWSKILSTSMKVESGHTGET